jgi:hypothetical protein
MSVAEVERWLGQNLNYDPAEKSPGSVAESTRELTPETSKS